jgi:GTP-binding protein YchF
MQVGLVGFRAAGKTTVFNALTGLRADTGFGNKDQANLGNIKVPDPRVDFTAEIFEPKKKTYAEIAFVDVAGPEGGAEQKGLDTRITDEMRRAEVLVHVVRDFESMQVDVPPDPMRDLVDFESELALTDLLQADTRLERLRKENKNTSERVLLERLHAHLETGAPLRTLELTGDEKHSLHGFAFLSLKPCILLVNRAEADAAAGVPSGLDAAAAERGLTAVAMAASAEAEIAELSPEDQASFLEDLGLEGSARDRFIQTAYARLDLISFLTVGEDECRAWTIERGTTAKEAAGKIHSDLERGFIRAEVIAYDDFVEHRSEAKCREAGKLRVEGKDYVVRDGDLMHIRFNV